MLKAGFYSELHTQFILDVLSKHLHHSATGHHSEGLRSSELLVCTVCRTLQLCHFYQTGLLTQDLVAQSNDECMNAATVTVFQLLTLHYNAGLLSTIQCA